MYCRQMLFAAVLGAALTVQAKTVKVSQFGFNAADSTVFLQKAIDSGAEKVILDKQSSPWISGPLTLRSNLELYLEDDTELAALPGSFLGARDSLLTAAGAKNILIRGGKNARISMRKKDYQDPERYQSAEWRTTVNLLGAENVTVRDIRISSSGGDGIYLGSLPKRKDIPCRNILVDHVILDDHHRQGISVIAVSGFKLLNSVIRDTSGTAPQAGIDFEPNNPLNHLENILIENCRFINNAGGGIMVCPPCRTPVSITIRNCAIEGGTRGFGINRLKNVPVSGEVLIENCTFTDVQGDVFIFRNQPSHIFRPVFRNCTIRSKKAAASASPVVFNVNNDWSDKIGNMAFENFTIQGYEKANPIDFRSLKSKAHLEKISGTFLFNGKTVDAEKFIAGKGWDKARPGAVRSYKAAELVPPAGKASKKISAKLRNTVWILLSPTEKKELEFTLQITSLRPPRKIVMDLFRPDGEAQEFPELTKKGTYKFKLKAGRKGVYVLMLKIGSGVLLFQPGAGQHWAVSSAGEEFINLCSAKGHKFYFEVPAGVKKFSIDLTGSANEPVSAEVISPEGKVAAAVQEIVSGQVLTVERRTEDREIWSIRFPLMAEDAYLRLQAPLLPVLANNPGNVFSAAK